MTARSAHLPDAFVGVLPAALQEVHERELQSPFVRTFGQFAPGVIQRVHHLAVDIELELTAGGVADPDRRRVLVSGQPVELQLGQSPFAGDAVHDLQPARIAGGGAEQPVPPRDRFLLVACGEECEQAEGCIAQPAVAVVPVANAADRLGQRCRRCRHDRTGARVREPLQHDD